MSSTAVGGAYSNVRTGKLKLKAKKKKRHRANDTTGGSAAESEMLPPETKERPGWEKPSGHIGTTSKKSSKSRKKRKSKRERETEKSLDEFEKRKREKNKERGKDPDEEGEDEEQVASDDSEAEYEELLKNLTPAQRNFLKQKRKREEKNMQKSVAKSHREKIDELNDYLSKMPVQNDIPKVAAAGVG
eukprot:gb/GECG01004745.1/.p1 GENE.gb/GECG01004745.1/~~gb/GECG01004745.1/.p1  ORF type:complete len:188 (+),score=51.84 gb/GECG01004745.1/:1-564(+)